MKIVVYLATAVLLSSPLAAQALAPATGAFASKDVRFDVRGAVAFTAPSASITGKTALLVVVSNARINSRVLADFIDRRLAVEKIVKDDETAGCVLRVHAGGTIPGPELRFRVRQ
jgi:hypothetical protein